MCVMLRIPKENGYASMIAAARYSSHFQWFTFAIFLSSEFFMQKAIGSL